MTGNVLRLGHLNIIGRFRRISRAAFTIPPLPAWSTCFLSEPLVETLDVLPDDAGPKAPALHGNLKAANCGESWRAEDL